MTINLSGSEVDEVAANMTIAAKEAQGFFHNADTCATQVGARLDIIATDYDTVTPKIKNLLAWAKAVLIAALSACVFVIIAALSIIFG